MILSIMSFFATLSTNDTQHNDTQREDTQREDTQREDTQSDDTLLNDIKHSSIECSSRSRLLLYGKLVALLTNIRLS